MALISKSSLAVNPRSASRTPRYSPVAEPFLGVEIAAGGRQLESTSFGTQPKIGIAHRQARSRAGQPGRQPDAMAVEIKKRSRGRAGEVEMESARRPHRRRNDGPDVLEIVAAGAGRPECDRAAIDLGGLILMNRHAMVAQRGGHEGKASTSPLNTRSVVVPPSLTDRPNSVPRSTNLPPGVRMENPRARGGTRAVNIP